jgi:subtilase family serine protease
MSRAAKPSREPLNCYIMWRLAIALNAEDSPMSRRTRLGAAVAAIVAAAPLTLLATSPATSAEAATTPLARTTAHRIFAKPPTNAQCEAAYHLACYTPLQFQQAYNLNPLYKQGLTGAGTTIAVVDSFGDPQAAADLAKFDKAFGLPAPPSIKTIAPAGKLPKFNPKNEDMSGWAGETDLDVQYAHAMAPGANILIVATPVSETEGTAGFPQIVKAENYVVSHHLADVISQSFGATEQTFPSKASVLGLRSAFKAADAAGISVLAASGDAGATDASNTAGTKYYLHRVTSWPDSDPLVTGVGGLQYFLNAKGNSTQPPAVWNDDATIGGPSAGGGGKSIFFARPSYQNSVANRVGDQRGVPDISMSAAVNGGAIMYVGTDANGGDPGGFTFSGGTSEASPTFAGVVALADQLAGHPLGLLNPAIYRLDAEHAPGIVDVTSGTNTVTFKQGGKQHTVIGFDARKGYDLASGVGGINGALFVPELVAASFVS